MPTCQNCKKKDYKMSYFLLFVENMTMLCPMETGLVKWFNNKKGFGFILNDSGEDVFVHYSVIQGDGFRKLQEGEKVQFEYMKGPKGLHATAVVANA